MGEVGHESGTRHPDHEAEQRRLRAARSALDAMVARAERGVESSDVRVREEDSVDARLQRAHMVGRRTAVSVGEVNLCFGRIDEDPEIAQGDRWYVGRRHIEDAEGNPLVVDWRAPVAVPFYRATAADPFGLALRRRFSCDVDELLAIFDEHLDDPSSVTATGIPDPVLAEIERGRSGEMADIVATIAAEQDRIIRSPLAECLLVQGGPGTGKTAVGLHRAAFLLFEHRAELSQSQVLVIGPNRVFLRYVGNVLPSLGETAVTQATITSLLSARVRVRGEERPEIAEVKGRAEMATVLRRLALARIRPPTDAVVVPVGLRSLRFEPESVDDARATALDGSLPLNDAKGVFTEVLLRDARRQLQDRKVGPDELQRASSDLRSSPEFRRLVDRAWPGLSGPQLVRSLLGSRAARRRAAAGLLPDGDQELLHRPAAKKVGDEPWTEADLPLLDEANALTAGIGRRYGHVVVDEAQDLSAMALRAAGRRATAGSMTILGDLAQATGIGAQSGWDEVAAALGVQAAAVRRAELTVGYRVPGPILDYANRLLPVTAPDVAPSSSIRRRGDGPVHHSTDDLGASVVRTASELAEQWPSIGVIVPPTLFDSVIAPLLTAGLDVGDMRTGGDLDHHVSVLAPPTAKGLEFDAAIVVEPGAFVDLPNGLRLLYVALTRAVQRLVIVRSRPIPPPLGGN